MNELVYFERTAGVEQMRVSQSAGIEAPTFFPELKGVEDLEVLANCAGLLKEATPLLVPGSKWSEMRSDARLASVSPVLKGILSTHPKILYEPPELFRHKMPLDVIEFGARGNRSRKAAIRKAIKEGRTTDALAMLPLFFQPFAEAQLANVQYGYGVEAGSRDDEGDTKIASCWSDPRADKGFHDYFAFLANEAKRYPNTTLISPAPPITQSSESQDLKRMIGANRFMAALCESMDDEREDLVPYFHAYVDAGTMRKSSDLASKVHEAIDKELRAGGRYSGVAITITGYERAHRQGLQNSLRQFVADVSHSAEAFHMPLLLPRSGWYGLSLTDHGAHAYSSMLNNRERLAPKMGVNGGMAPKALYGTVPIIDHALEFDVDKVANLLERDGELPHIDGVAGRPPTWNPDGKDAKTRFGSPVAYRKQYAKPQWLAVRMEEARRIRNGRHQGLTDAATRYFQRSEHPFLKVT